MGRLRALRPRGGAQWAAAEGGAETLPSTAAAAVRAAASTAHRNTANSRHAVTDYIR